MAGDIDLASALFEISTDYSKMERGLDQASQKIEDFTKNAGAKFERFGLLTASILGVAVVGALAKLGQATGDYIYQIDILSNRLGTTAQEGSVLIGVFERLGIANMVAARAISGFASRMEETQRALDPFATKMGRLLGSMRDSSGAALNLTQSLDLARQKISSTADQTERLMMAQDLFGRFAGSRLIEVLSQGGDAWEKFRKEVEASGIGLDAVSEQMGRQWQQGISQVSQQLRGLSLEIGVAVLPSLLAMTKMVGDVASGLKSIADKNPMLVAFFGAFPSWSNLLILVTAGILGLIRSLGVMQGLFGSAARAVAGTIGSNQAASVSYRNLALSMDSAALSLQKLIALQVVQMPVGLVAGAAGLMPKLPVPVAPPAVVPSAAGGGGVAAFLGGPAIVALLGGLFLKGIIDAVAKENFDELAKQELGARDDAARRKTAGAGAVGGAGRDTDTAADLKEAYAYYKSFETARKAGISLPAEVGTPEEARAYLDKSFQARKAELEKNIKNAEAAVNDPTSSVRLRELRQQGGTERHLENLRDRLGSRPAVIAGPGASFTPADTRNKEEVARLEKEIAITEELLKQAQALEHTVTNNGLLEASLTKQKQELSELIVERNKLVDLAALEEKFATAKLAVARDDAFKNAAGLGGPLRTIEAEFRDAGVAMNMLRAKDSIGALSVDERLTLQKEAADHLAKAFQEGEKFNSEFLRVGQQLGLLTPAGKISALNQRAQDQAGRGDVFGAADTVHQARTEAFKQFDERISFERQIRIVSFQDELSFLAQKLRAVKGNAEEEMRIAGQVAQTEKQLYKERADAAISAIRSIGAQSGEILGRAPGAPETAADLRAKQTAVIQKLPGLAAGSLEDQDLAATTAQDMLKQLEGSRKRGEPDGMIGAWESQLKRYSVPVSADWRRGLPGWQPDESEPGGNGPRTTEALAVTGLNRQGSPELDMSWMNIQRNVGEVLQNLIPNFRALSEVVAKTVISLGGTAPQVAFPGVGTTAPSQSGTSSISPGGGLSVVGGQLIPRQIGLNSPRNDPGYTASDATGTQFEVDFETVGTEITRSVQDQSKQVLTQHKEAQSARDTTNRLLSDVKDGLAKVLADSGQRTQGKSPEDVMKIVAEGVQGKR